MSTPIQIAWVKRIDNSRLVRQRHPGSVRECVVLLGLAAVCLGVVLLCAWQHFRYLHHGYQLEKLQARYEQVKEWNRTLQLEQAAF